MKGRLRLGNKRDGAAEGSGEQGATFGRTGDESTQITIKLDDLLLIFWHLCHQLLADVLILLIIEVLKIYIYFFMFYFSFALSLFFKFINFLFLFYIEGVD